MLSLPKPLILPETLRESDSPERMTGWWTGLGSEPTPFPGDQGSRINTVWPQAQETPGKVPGGNGAVEYEDSEWSPRFLSIQSVVSMGPQVCL